MKSLLPPELQAGWDVRDTVPRRERMAELAFAGYRIPRCGPFREMVRLGVPLVVYTDEFAHCGEGKVLFKHGGFVPDWPAGTFCSEYKPDAEDWSDEYDSENAAERSSQWHSRRELWVGFWKVQLRYASRDSWMSNVNGTCEVVGFPELAGYKYRELMPYPMFSVDYTAVECGGAYPEAEDFHFDLNTCPGVPVEVVNMVGRDLLTASVRDFSRSRGLIR